MERSLIYNGTITAEQFLFYEIRIASKYYLDGKSVEDAIEEIKKNNLFQYPTERLVARMVRSCYKRLDALDDEQLRQELSSAPSEIAKQINLYAMMRYNRIVWDFMVGVIGEKFRSQDFEFSRKDLNVFFSHLQEQNDDIAGWSETTVNKIKHLLNSCVSQELLSIQPTLNNQPGTIGSIPLLLSSDETIVDSFVKQNITLSKDDWDSYETSWDFKRNPLV